MRLPQSAVSKPITPFPFSLGMTPANGRGHAKFVFNRRRAAPTGVCQAHRLILEMN
jgi:hypothetical protein